MRQGGNAVDKAHEKAIFEEIWPPNATKYTDVRSRPAFCISALRTRTPGSCYGLFWTVLTGYYNKEVTLIEC